MILKAKFNMGDEVFVIKSSSKTSFYERKFIIDEIIFKKDGTVLYNNKSLVEPTEESLLHKTPQYKYLYTYLRFGEWVVSLERYKDDNDFKKQNPPYTFFQKIEQSKQEIE